MANYKFTYSELEDFADAIKANADAQLDALAQLNGYVKNLTTSDKFKGKAAKAIKSYFADMYTSIVPIMSLIITNHAKNYLLYIKAYANAEMGGKTAIKTSELKNIKNSIQEKKSAFDSADNRNTKYRTSSEFTKALGSAVVPINYTAIERNRQEIIKLLDDTLNDINDIESYYRKSTDYDSEFTGARVGLENLKRLFKDRTNSGSTRIKDYNAAQFWSSEEGIKLKKAAISLWYEGYLKEDAFDTVKVSDNEFKNFGASFDVRENGDDLDFNKYFQAPFNTCLRNWHGGNCTWYAWGRFMEAQGYEKDENTAALAEAFSTVDAVNFWERAQKMGYEVGQEPREGAIMVWGYDGSELGAPGHVAFVESIDKNGTVHTTESGWSGGKFWTDSYTSANNYGRAYRNAQFRGFIYPANTAPVKMNDEDKAFLKELKSSKSKATLPVEKMPAAKNCVSKNKYELDVDGNLGHKSSKSTQVIFNVKEDKDWGPETVKAIQKKVGAKQDGEWGPETTKAMQKYLGVTVDGELGPETKKAWQKFVNEELGRS